MEHKLKMGSFSLWLEARQEDLQDSLRIVLGALDLDEKGATTPLSSLVRKAAASKVRSVERYGSLARGRKDAVDAALEAEDSTVLDVAKAMAGYDID